MLKSFSMLPLAAMFVAGALFVGCSKEKPAAPAAKSAPNATVQEPRCIGNR